ncbi:hypothetical protein GCM10017044_25330 [Kordiimonas sediminis]|uniref:Rieske domain-containing protein n=1 Tax=Kordiimonas sediminis TaxID=1735581 RepID=A0A919AWH4_9PROT|nr:Rieske (2Fe-2S) protein [Kordiimonas sediminis]GHF29015.1 hypothetical protein GCM10017044_25330 [Kordiimonas sediminis]
MTHIWTKATSITELQKTGRLLRKIDGVQVALFQTKSGVRAVSNRCPHEGFPLIEGTLNEKCQLACNWHGWTFDLETGEAVQGRDAVKVFPVLIKGDDILVDISPDPVEKQLERADKDIREAVDEYDYERLARGLARQEKAGGDGNRTTLDILAWSVDRLERGFGHAHAGLADWLTLADAYPDKALHARLEAYAIFSWDCRFSPFSPVPEGTMPWDREKFLDALEQMDQQKAVRMVRGAVASGLGFRDLEPVFQDFVYSHYAGFGHPVIFLQKARELVDRLGAGAEKDLMIQLSRYFVLSAREDLIPEFKSFRIHLHTTEAETIGALPGPETLSTYSVRELHRVTAGAIEPPQQVWETLLHAAALQLLRFKEEIQHRTDNPVGQNIGFLDFTHALTFAEAGYIHAKKRPELWHSLNLQLGCFVGRNSSFIDPNASYEDYVVADADLYLDHVTEALFDMDAGAYIYSVHRLKSIMAVKRLLPSVSAETGRVVVAALNRYLSIPARQHHTARTVNQARATVAREG